MLPTLSVKPQRQQSGFTLIEVMAVMLVIGVTVGVVSLSVGGGSRSYEVKASVRQVYNVINLAIEEAVFYNRQLGLRFDIDTSEDESQYTYQWMSYDFENKHWLVAEQEELQKKKLPIGIDLNVEVDKQQVIIGSYEKEDIIFEVKKSKNEKVEIHPDIYFFSSGEMQNFSITIIDRESPDIQFVIEGNMIGQLTYKISDEN